MPRNKKIYFDHAATTPLDIRVLNKMTPFLRVHYGNPSSIHFFGQKAQQGVDEAREKIAKVLKAKPSEIIFTSGATEANNTVLKGVLKARKNLGNHLITSSIEHPSVLETAKFLKKEGFRASYMPVTRLGIVNKEIVRKVITPKTVLISLMYANNEIGSINPISEIGKIIEKINLGRQVKKLPKVYFHVDAVQAVQFLDCSVAKLKVDFLTLSGHKIYGPKGVGIFYCKKGAALEPLLSGGHQERNLRAGTLNVSGIVGFATALELAAKEQKNRIKKMISLKKYLLKQIKDKIKNIRVNSNIEENLGLPNILNVSFLGAEGESILIKLDLAGIAVSTGSACSSGTLEPSHVLTALGLKPVEAHSSIRFSFGKDNTLEEIDALMLNLPRIVKDLRRMSPLKISNS